MTNVKDRAMDMDCRVFAVSDTLLLVHRPKNDGDDKWYNVDLEERSCECPYFRYNEGDCKHIIRAAVDLDQGEAIQV